MNPEGDASPEAIAKMVNHVADKIGRKHVGMGVDFVHNYADALGVIVRTPEKYSPLAGYGAISEMALPSDVWGAVVILEEKYDWSKEDVQGFLGHNLMRVYAANWK